MIDIRDGLHPYALFTDNVCTNVLYMMDRTEEEIEELLSQFTYDKVITWEEAGQDLFEGIIDFGDYYAPPSPWPSWVWNNDRKSWFAPVEHPYDAIIKDHPILSQRYEWDEELKDWVVEGPRNCCGN